ncbi:MAG: Phenylacetic acid catabolic protein, partial [Sphingomicrobium sp.]
MKDRASTGSARTEFVLASLETIEVSARTEYLLRLGDDALVLGQRVSEWCGHGPVLEVDISLANLALDLIG